MIEREQAQAKALRIRGGRPAGVRQSLAQRGEPPKHLGAHRGRAESLELEAVAELRISAVKLCVGFVDHGQRLDAASEEAQQARSLGGDLGPPLRCAGQCRSFDQMLFCVCAPGVARGHRELKEQRFALGIVMRLGKRSAQVRSGDVRRAEGRRSRCHVSEDVENPCFADRRRERNCAATASSGALVARNAQAARAWALRRCHSVVDRGSHDRVHEAQRLLGREHVRVGEHLAAVRASSSLTAASAAATPTDAPSPSTATA